MPDRPFVLVGQQYLADPTRSSGPWNPLYAYAHVPAGYTGDATSAIEDQIERFAPGFRERIVARHVRTPHDFAQENANYVGGDVVTGLNSGRQLVFRPRIALDPYSVGLPGIYLCSAATPPGAGAHGMCGYNAAASGAPRPRRILKIYGLRRRARRQQRMVTLTHVTALPAHDPKEPWSPRAGRPPGDHRCPHPEETAGNSHGTRFRPPAGAGDCRFLAAES
jgi:hypothetical protein